MTAVALAARLLLAAVLAVAAVAKATSRSPVRSGRVEAVAVPAVELITAVLLVARSYAAAPAWFAVALLAGFTVVLFRERARNPGAPCNCFGALSRAPITGRTIMRNAVLIALAIVATGTRS